MNRREFVTALASSVGAASVPGFAEHALGSWGSLSKSGKPPNIVLMLVDDLGYGDFSCYGDSFHETPNIDQLAREGMKFTQAYAGAPVCSPSRAAIMTGQAPARLHLTQWIPGVIYPHKRLLEPKTALHLPAGVPTVASELKKLGYRTAAIGKWHLGGEGYYPENFGFDVNIAGDDHGHPAPPHGYFGPFHYHNLTGYSEQDNLTEVLTQKTEQFLDEAAPKGPFFLYLAEYSVHLPLQERAAHIAKYKRKNHDKDEPDPIYAAMVESVDTALGRVRAKLTQLGVADNTIILLTSDNGGVGFQGRKLHRIADNGGLHAGKGFLYEGGIREPLIVRWPGVTKDGSICDTPVSGCDFLPTLLSIVGGATSKPAINPTPLDGIDISPLFRGATSVNRDTLYWHYPHYSDQGGTPSGAIHEGDWKLIEFFEDGHLELYNLKLDAGEQYDFASSFADKTRDLHAKLKQWRAQMHADMPTPNPNWNVSLLNEHKGMLGCSAQPIPGCLED